MSELRIQSRTRASLVDKQIDIFKDLEFHIASTIMEKAIHKFQNMDVDKVEVVYNKFVNAITQEVIVDQLLPLEVVKKDSKETIRQLKKDGDKDSNVNRR